MLTENVIEVEKNIQAACDRAGRSREEVRLIAVSKTKPVSDIEEVLTMVYLIMVRIKYRNCQISMMFCRRISDGI